MKKRIVGLSIVVAVFLLTMCTVVAGYGDPRFDGWYYKSVSEDGSAASVKLTLMPNEYSVNGVLNIMPYSAEELDYVNDEGIKVTYTDRNGAEQIKYITKSNSQSDNPSLVIDDISAETSTITASYTYAVHDVRVRLSAEYTGYNEENESRTVYAHKSVSSGGGSSTGYDIENIIPDSELVFDKTTGTITGCTDTTHSVLLLKDEIDGVTINAIADGVFENMTSLEYVCLDTYNEITIGNNAFKNCGSLSGVYLRRGIKSIGSDAFSGCTNISEVAYDGWKSELNAIDIKAGNTALTGLVEYYNWSYSLSTNYKPENTEKFYYTLNGKTVRVSLDGTVDFSEDTDKNIIISCYDNGTLIKAALLPLNASVNSASLNDFEIELPTEPRKLTVRAFAWSGFDKCAPLCDAAELTDIPKSAYYVTGRVVKTGKTDSSLYKGQVDFRIEASDNFDGEIIDDPYDGYTYTMYADDTDIDRHMMEPVNAYIIKDENDEYHILKYTPEGGVQPITLTKSDIDLENSDRNKLVTTDGRELDISALENYYVNRIEASISDNTDLLEFINNMQAKYSKIQLADIDAEDGKLDCVLLESYFGAVIDEISHGKDSDKIYFSEADIDISYMTIYPDEEENIYNFYNEKMEKCDKSLLDNYTGKKIYIAYDYYYSPNDSYFYDIILENAQPAQTIVTHTDRLSHVDSTAVLRYSESDNTAILDGDLVFDSDGNMPLDININFIKDNEVISAETIKATTALKNMRFGYKAYFGEDYRYTGRKYTLPQKPDKAVLSFNAGSGSEIPDINVPIISADAYEVYGRVTSTSRMNEDLAAGQVEYRVERAEYFDGEYVGRGDNQTYTMYYSDVNTPSMLREYSCAYIRKGANGDYTIEAIKSAAPQKSVTLSAEDFDIDKSLKENTYSSDRFSLYFYPAGATRNSEKYSVLSDCTVYVNGVPHTFTTEELIHFIDQYSSAEIQLMKETAIGSTSSYADYNIIMINVYDTAVVESVTKNADTVTIAFADYSGRLSDSMVVSADSDYAYSFSLNGEAVNPSELKKNDVLSIAYDIEGSFIHSGFYDVLVSRNTVSGHLLSYSDEGIYNVGGTTYKLSDGMSILLDFTSEYKLYLDIFGHIAHAEEIEVPRQLAVFKNLYKKAGGDWYAQLITPEGGKEYKVDDLNVMAYGALLNPSFDGSGDAAEYNIADRAEKWAQQIIEYRVSSTEKLTIISRDSEGNTAFVNGASATAEYEEGTSKIGNVTVGDDTVILDISGDDVKLLAKENLVNGYEYSAYGYNQITDENGAYHAFVLLTSGHVDTAIVVMEYYDGTTAWLYGEEELLELKLDNEQLLNALTETRTDRKAAYVIHDYQKVLDVELLSPEKTTGVYENGYIGEYQVPKHISCHYPEIGFERGVSACLIEGNSYDVLKFKKGARALTLIDGDIDEGSDTFTGILSSVYDDKAVITDTDGNTNTYRIPEYLTETFSSVTAPAGIYYDYNGEYLTEAQLPEKTGDDITGTYQNGKIGSYTVPEYVYFYDENDHRAYKIPSSALVTDEEYTVKQYGDDRVISFIDDGALSRGEEFKYGILKNIYKGVNGSWYAQIINDECAEENYPIDDGRADSYKALIGVTETYGLDYTGDRANRYPNQVIQYSISATGKLYIQGDSLLYGTEAEGTEYVQRTSKIGAVRMGEDTIILDITKADDDKITRITTDRLIDGLAYTAYGYDKTTSGENYYRYVLITDGTDSYNSRTQLAIFNSMDATVIDGEVKPVLNLIYDGEEKQYVVSDDLYFDYDRLGNGDALIFMTDYDNEITRITPVFSQMSLLSGADWDSFRLEALSAPEGIVVQNNWRQMLQDGYSDEMDIVFGVAIHKNGSSITLCETLEDGKYANYDTGLELYCSDAKIYTYNFAGPRNSKLSTDEGLMATPNYAAYTTTNSRGQDLLDVTNVDIADDLVFAVARVDGDIVEEIYQIVTD